MEKEKGTGGAAPAGGDLDAAVGAAVERIFAGKGIELDHVVTSDGLSRMMGAVEKFKDAVVSGVPEIVGRTFDEKFKAAMGGGSVGEGVLARFERMEAQLKANDMPGNPLSVRSPQTVSEAKTRAYAQIGKGITVAAYRAANLALPKEYEGFARSQLAGTDTKGGVGIPEMRLTDWMRIRPDHSVARKMFRSVPLTDALTMIVPTLVTGADQAGRLTTEGTTASPESDADFLSEANSSVTAEVLSTWVGISRKMPPSYFQQMEDFIGQLLMEAAGQLEDVWFLNGTSPFTTMVAVSTTKVRTMSAGKVAFEDADWRDFQQLQFSVDPNVIGNGVYLMHPSVFGHASGLVDGVNRPLANTGFVTVPGMTIDSPVSNGPPAMLLNRPCFLSTAMPDLSASAPDTTMALYLDPTKGLIGDSQQASVEIDDSLDRSKFMRRLYMFEVVAFKYFIAAASAALKTAAA